LVVLIPKVIAEIALLVAGYTGKTVRALREPAEAISKLGGKFPALSDICAWATSKMDDVIAEISYGSVFLNSAKLHAADSYVSDSDEPAAAFQHAYRTSARARR
jgi:hypothetical protein